MAETSEKLEKEMITLVSQENEDFQISLEAAKISKYIDGVINSSEEKNEELQNIPVHSIKSFTLQKVIEFAEHFVDEPMTPISKVRSYFFWIPHLNKMNNENHYTNYFWKSNQPLKSDYMSDVVSDWYVDFIDVEVEYLFDMIQAADMLGIPQLFDLTSATIASMIRAKKTEEIRGSVSSFRSITLCPFSWLPISRILGIFNIVNDFTPEEEAKEKEYQRRYIESRS